MGTGENGNLTLSERIRRLSQGELVMLLRKRRHYRPEAVEEAVNEALRRGIIRSEEDLLQPAFSEPRGGFSFFPTPDHEAGKEKLLKSLLRGVMIAGVIPIIYGVLKFTIQKYVEGSGLISLGIIWIALAWWVMEKHEKKVMFGQLLLLFFSLIYTLRIMLSFQHLRWSDFLFPFVLYGVLVYFLLYVRRLLGDAGSDPRE